MNGFISTHIYDKLGACPIWFEWLQPDISPLLHTHCLFIHGWIVRCSELTQTLVETCAAFHIAVQGNVVSELTHKRVSVVLPKTREGPKYMREIRYHAHPRREPGPYITYRLFAVCLWHEK